MAFGDDLKGFSKEVTAKTQRIFVNAASHVHRSITVGSPVTGAPGQPVGQYGPGYHPGEVGGTLRASWQLTFESKAVALISTKIQWAVQNEEGVTAWGGPYHQRSTVGGRHSVALTRAGYARIVQVETDDDMGGTR